MLQTCRYISATRCLMLGKYFFARMKEERSKTKTGDESDISSWVKKIRKIEAKKNAEKEKAFGVGECGEDGVNHTNA